MEYIKKLASMEIYCSDISRNTEYEEIKKILEFPYHMVIDYEPLLICKKILLSLLYDISDTYKIARETFIHYKRLLETVTEGYIALNENFFTQDMEWKLNQYKEKDKELINKKDSYNLQNSEDIPTFEKAHKIGAIENIKSSSKKCHNKLIYWDSLIGTGKLQVIFGYKKMKALENAINEEYKQLNIEMQETVFENKGFNYNKSYAHLIQYLL
ncbi:hypothetical protein ABID39_001255 [Bartonella japonica]|uniref:Uncharacterized protein n=1 Tax=Bartonella japonica TaxID=357761 RepID=A0ABV2FPY6_9HYPH